MRAKVAKSSRGCHKYNKLKDCLDEFFSFKIPSGARQITTIQPGIPASVEVGVCYFISKVLRDKAGQAFGC